MTHDVGMNFQPKNIAIKNEFYFQGNFNKDSLTAKRKAR